MFDFLQVSFIGTKGADYRSDMAIDHIELTPGTCGNPGTN